MGCASPQSAEFEEGTPLSLEGQNGKENEFLLIDVDSLDISKEQKITSSFSINKIDLEGILLLDSSFIDEIEKVSPKLVEGFRQYYVDAPMDIFEDTIKTNFQSLAQCFNDSQTLKRILKVAGQPEYSDSYTMGKVVYIRNDSIAIFDIYGSFWSERNRIELNKGFLRIEMIYSIVEWL